MWESRSQRDILSRKAAHCWAAFRHLSKNVVGKPPLSQIGALCRARTSATTTLSEKNGRVTIAPAETRGHNALPQVALAAVAHVVIRTPVAEALVVVTPAVVEGGADQLVPTAQAVVTARAPVDSVRVARVQGDHVVPVRALVVRVVMTAAGPRADHARAVIGTGAGVATTERTRVRELLRGAVVRALALEAAIEQTPNADPLAVTAVTARVVVVNTAMAQTGAVQAPAANIVGGVLRAVAGQLRGVPKGATVRAVAAVRSAQTIPLARASEMWCAAMTGVTNAMMALAVVTARLRGPISRPPKFLMTSTSVNSTRKFANVCAL